LSVGEDPQLIPGVDTRLATGMVLALEPAVYFRGRFGVRVEDVFVVTERGAVPIGSA
jgi:Xaa-Pro aminopeptidase